MHTNTELLSSRATSSHGRWVWLNESVWPYAHTVCWLHTGSTFRSETKICTGPWSLAETNEGESAEFTVFPHWTLSVNRAIHKHSHFARDSLSKSERRPNWNFGETYQTWWSNFGNFSVRRKRHISTHALELQEVDTELGVWIEQRVSENFERKVWTEDFERSVSNAKARQN